LLSLIFPTEKLLLTTILKLGGKRKMNKIILTDILERGSVRGVINACVNTSLHLNQLDKEIGEKEK
jgi:hypothetical protein